MFSPPLKTERFIIREFKAQDLSDFLEFMLDEDSTKYLAFTEEQKTKEGAEELFDLVCNSYQSESPIHSYAIAEKNSGRYVGSCGFAAYDRGIYECYYSVNRAKRGGGIATEVTRALAEALSDTFEIRAYCHPENYAAHKVAKNAGFGSKGLSLHKNFNLEGELFIYGDR